MNPYPTMAPRRGFFISNCFLLSVVVAALICTRWLSRSTPRDEKGVTPSRLARRRHEPLAAKLSGNPMARVRFRRHRSGTLRASRGDFRKDLRGRPTHRRPVSMRPCGPVPRRYRQKPHSCRRCPCLTPTPRRSSWAITACDRREHPSRWQRACSALPRNRPCVDDEQSALRPSCPACPRRRRR